MGVDLAEERIRRGGRVHLMGVGGIGMAGVAWLLKERGFQVSGCDLQSNRQTEWLKRKGVQISIGHDPSHLNGSVDWLVRSTAVPRAHPEVQRAEALEIPVSRRGEVLPALMRDRVCIAVSGTHGKTTTTALIAQVLGCGFCVGGEIFGFDGVAQEGDIMVVEADESDGTIAGYTPDYAVITNIEYDHMEHHRSEAAFIRCFEQLIQNTKERVFYREDDPIARRLCCDNPKCEAFVYPVERLPVSLPGRHNQWNASAARAVAENWKSDAKILQALGAVQSIRRRFETVFEGGGVRIISDYAHHPTEIAALIQTASELKPKRLLGVFQPHRFTRTLALSGDFPASFDGLDKLWILPVYAASEQPLEGGSSADLMARFPVEWNPRIEACASFVEMWAILQNVLKPGDLLLIIGAGDIEQLAEWARAGLSDALVRD